MVQQGGRAYTGFEENSAWGKSGTSEAKAMFPVESQTNVRSDPILPLTTRLGPVRIGVTEREKALAIWRDVVGLAVIREHGDVIELGVGTKVMIILEPGAAGPAVPKSLGLYHVAIHVPARRDLAQTALRAIKHNVRILPTDHLVSEAIYLWDYDGNGIEMTFETPWRGSYGDAEAGYYAKTADGNVHSGKERIDLDDLLGELGPHYKREAVLPVGTRIGHVHVHVNDLHEAMRFYRDGLGFGGLFIIEAFGMGDVRLNYMPHTIAFNIWSGHDAAQPPAGSAGLRWFTIMLPDAETLEGVRARLARLDAPMEETEGGIIASDPSGNRLRLLVG
jgi:catechol 2,3-dioxygenase